MNRKLRPYQTQLKADIYAAWAEGHKNIMPVMPCGAGKTMTVADIINEHNGAAISLAHRAELIAQMSLAFARFGIRHRIVGPASLARTCAAGHARELGRSFVDPRARMYVSSVQTLRRMNPEPWMLEVTLGACDEGQHALLENTWGIVMAKFPNAKWIMPTATPLRADGKGLGRHADGLADVMVLGPGMHELILDGYLTATRIFSPPSDIDITEVAVTSGGDFSPTDLSKAVHKSRTIMGDVVGHYLRLTPNKKGLVFAVDVPAAVEYAEAFRAAGVTAEVVTGTTPANVRAEVFRRLATGDLSIVTNVGIAGEGTDIPAVEVVIDVAHTLSYGLWRQRVGRQERPSPGKNHGFYIDHVGNALRHVPRMMSAQQDWSLDRRERRTRNAPDDVIPLRTCTKCTMVYERIYALCPYCGTVHPITDRSAPEAVTGDLAEFSPELLARLRGEIDKPVAVPYGATAIVVASVKKMHRERGDAQRMLRRLMSYYGGYLTSLGDDVGMQQRKFYINFGIDVLSAMALNKSDAIALAARVMEVLREANVEFTLDTGE
jgi:superfamily II DNA or RNA helicase